jgi:spore cortex biosynthesis protein YabQ
MWEISITDQLFTFLYSLGLGIIISLFYDIISSFRSALALKKKTVFFVDMGFWIINAFTVFLFLLSRTNGEIRGYVLLSILLGFILLRCTLSFYIVRFLSFVIKKVYKILSGIKRGFYSVVSIIYRFLEKIFKNIIIFCKKVLKYRKKS